eukprot:SAG11_NODE_826_length_6982_cov_4.139038_5_plen_99_part_00
MHTVEDAGLAREADFVELLHHRASLELPKIPTCKDCSALNYEERSPHAFMKSHAARELVSRESADAILTLVLGWTLAVLLREIREAVITRDKIRRTWA